MSEQHPQPIQPSQPEQADTPHVGERYPTEQELYEFEGHQEFQRGTGKRGRARIVIEEFAEDPNNPTPDEIAAVEEINRVNGLHVDTFEEYFGYPDPRVKPDERPDSTSSDDE